MVGAALSAMASTRLSLVCAVIDKSVSARRCNAAPVDTGTGQTLSSATLAPAGARCGGLRLRYGAPSALRAMRKRSGVRPPLLALSYSGRQCERVV